MNTKIALKILKYFTSLALAVGIIYFLFKNQDPVELVKEIEKVDGKWVILSMIFGTKKKRDKKINEVTDVSPDEESSLEFKNEMKEIFEEKVEENLKSSDIELDETISEIKSEESNLDDDLASPLLEDLNTPGFISKLHLLYEKASKGDKSSKKLFLEGCKLIGLMEENQESWKNFKKTKINIDENTIELKIKERENARKKGNYKLADDIRKELEENGISIEDKNNKTIWKYK